jgi:hypothetical protein
MLRGKRLAGIIENIETKFDQILDEKLGEKSSQAKLKNLTESDYFAPKWGIQG